MNTQNDFLDNLVDDEFDVDSAGDLNAEMCSSLQGDTEKMCSSLRGDTYRMCGGNTKETYLEVLCFQQFYRHFVFEEDEEGNRNERMEKYFEVSAVVDVRCGDTKS